MVLKRKPVAGIIHTAGNMTKHHTVSSKRKKIIKVPYKEKKKYLPVSNLRESHLPFQPIFVYKLCL